MTDSMCGPSNALQNLSKHTSTDHSLQRDRVRQGAGRAGTPLSNFRSSTSQTSAADADFARFTSQPLQQAPVPLPFAAANPLLRTGAPTFSATLPAASLDNWTSDFQNLQISGGPSLHQQHQQGLRSTKSSFFPQAASQQWRQEFSASPAPQLGPQSSLGTSQYSLAAGPSYSGFSPIYQQQLAPSLQQTGTAQQDDFQFDDSAFESAFAIAAQNLERSAAQLDPVETQNTMVVPEVVEEVEQKLEESENKAQNDADELARTAGQLLESVKGETSEKFQKSSFMALMKKLRDREAIIEGDNIVEKGQQ